MKQLPQGGRGKGEEERQRDGWEPKGGQRVKTKFLLLETVDLPKRQRV